MSTPSPTPLPMAAFTPPVEPEAPAAVPLPAGALDLASQAPLELPRPAKAPGLRFPDARPGDTTVLANVTLEVVSRPGPDRMVLQDPRDGASMEISSMIADLYELAFTRTVPPRRLPSGVGAFVQASSGEVLVGLGEHFEGSWLVASSGERLDAAAAAERAGEDWRVLRHSPEAWVPGTASEPGALVRAESATGSVEGVFVEVTEDGAGVVLDIGVPVTVPASGSDWFVLDEAAAQPDTAPIATPLA